MHSTEIKLDLLAHKHKAFHSKLKDLTSNLPSWEGEARFYSQFPLCLFMGLELTINEERAMPSLISVSYFIGPGQLCGRKK